jgi:hypothetical protein
MKRESKNLASSLEHRLSGYALAASAAGVSLVGLTGSAGGKVVYTPTHHVLKGNSLYDLALKHDGFADFVIGDDFNCKTDCHGSLYINPTMSHNGFEMREGFARALREGAVISARRIFSYAPGGVMAFAGFRSGGTFYSGGLWANVSNRYLGLSFTFNHERHFGWARLNVKISRKTAKLSAILTGYAYETIPNKSIIAGKTHGPDVITGEPASLGHLARGASAIPAWRAAGGNR